MSKIIHDQAQLVVNRKDRIIGIDLTLAQWNFLKRIIYQIKNEYKLYHNVSMLLFGCSISSFLYLLFECPENKKLYICYSVIAISVILGFAFLYIAKLRRGDLKMSADNVIEYMKTIEAQHNVPPPKT